MNDAQRALLVRLREIVDEAPESGAVNAGNKPLHVTRFAQAVENRADDGVALVAYVKSKVHGAAMASYSSLIKAGRPDLTVEHMAADADAAWASEFNEDDRAAARGRLGDMIETHRKAEEEAEAKAVTRDRSIAAEVSAKRQAKGQPALTNDQRDEMLASRAAKRSRD